ncbi:uncharacterized protein L969DRAFT_92129 [Mixia osmundae IAM 14324]|uniref:Origin recognition complex subunit 5 C-terminal domain-containing protein n=1 Tax=Mixia osmundae (strain CBS 9802 / IAM 14324 / JCM 22182 / KY 12970) TaxID=764103 RepID=G7E7C2_MIXOS|nr:uncharacterized protein L969DRAFT_92129 [Mixia osmundae IAM 14324]KEI42700.1 hypothetical protein L969DRAFT_92129 [Mixia osmundae IAM 14324]GAA98732.1 hypothetical protein E5Q_05420 [Mixia osmundae IAM 14324]
MDRQAYSEALPSLRAQLDELSMLVQTSYPSFYDALPSSSVWVEVTHNFDVLIDVIAACLEPRACTISQKPAVQNCLPKTCLIDCREICSTASLYDRILNGLASWPLTFCAQSGAVKLWNGRRSGCHVVRSRSDEWHVEWTTPTEDAPDNQSARHNTSFQAFCDGLRTVFDLQEQDHTLGSDSQLFAEQQRALPRAIIFTHADLLYDIAGDVDTPLFSSLVRIAELTRRPIVPVFVSSLPSRKLLSRRGYREPSQNLVIHRLETQDAKNILHRHLASQSDDDQNQIRLARPLVELTIQIYENLVGLELSQLIAICDAVWPHVQLRASQLHTADISALYRVIKDILEREREALYGTRFVSMDAAPGSALQLLDQQMPIVASPLYMTPSKRGRSNATQSPTSSACASPSKSPQKATIERRSSPLLSLPVIGRYLAIASYFASYNPAKSDVRMFAVEEPEGGRKKKGGGTRKTAQAPTKRKFAQLQLGPKLFSLGRMLAILEAILDVDDRSLASSVNVDAQIITLLQMGLISRSVAAAPTSIDRLANLKFRSHVTLAQADDLAKTVNLTLSERLWES